METLTIQHIAPYLPYGLDFIFEKHRLTDGKMTEYREGFTGFWTSDGSIVIRTTMDECDIKEVKPILYSISCLTKPIEHNGETFIPIVELAKIAFPDDIWGLDKDKDCLTNDSLQSFEFKNGSFMSDIWNDWTLPTHVRNQWQLFQKLAEWHINFNGIPEGLYIPKPLKE